MPRIVVHNYFPTRDRARFRQRAVDCGGDESCSCGCGGHDAVYNTLGQISEYFRNKGKLPPGVSASEMEPSFKESLLEHVRRFDQIGVRWVQLKKLLA